jgi:hypothetical protein
LNFSRQADDGQTRTHQKKPGGDFCPSVSSRRNKRKASGNNRSVFLTMKNRAVTMQSSSLVFLVVVSVILLQGSDAFSSPVLHATNARWSSQQGTASACQSRGLVHRGGRDLWVLHERSTSSSISSDDDNTPTNTGTPSSSSSSATTKSSLEEKMKGWQATDEEIRAATLGGVVPQRSDAFDLGLYIAFPIMVATGLLFAFFPFIMGSIDTSSVGPPPTM